MDNQEGVIKYQLFHEQAPIEFPFSVAEFNSWRTLLYRMQLIGQNPSKYGGLSYGNISFKPDSDNPVFIITGTQTSHFEYLSTNQFSSILKTDVEKNLIHSKGLCEPSSEALTHACVYAQSPATKVVVHVHCPEIWRQTQALKLAFTAAGIPYGTPEMGRAVIELFKSDALQKHPLFCMLGHADGVVAYGKTIKETVFMLFGTLAKAIEIEQQAKSS